MTPTEILSEIQKMPLTEKRQILRGLAEQVERSEQVDLNLKEKNFVSGLRRKGLITEIPNRLHDDVLRRGFKRIKIKGEPISETIVKERG